MGDDLGGGAGAGVAGAMVDSLADVGHGGALRPGALRVVEVVDAGGDGDPAPRFGLLILHAETDVVRGVWNVGLDDDRRAVEDDDVSDDVDGRVPADVHNEGDAVIGTVGRAVGGDVFDGDGGVANEAHALVVVLRGGDEDNGVLCRHWSAAAVNSDACCNLGTLSLSSLTQ